MSKVKTSLNHKKIRRLIWLVLTVFVLLDSSLQSATGTAYCSIIMQPYATVSSPPVFLEGGTAGSSTIYANYTSAKVSVGTTETYDYVLKVVNQVADNWTVSLQVYGSSNIARLSSLNISLHDGTSSNQIAVNNGSIIKSQGDPYNLPGGLGSTIYVSMSNLQVTTSDISYLYAYLKIQVPNTSTYNLFIIVFEIT